jgi:hypothetical protein
LYTTQQLPNETPSTSISCPPFLASHHFSSFAKPRDSISHWNPYLTGNPSTISTRQNEMAKRKCVREPTTSQTLGTSQAMILSPLRALNDNGCEFRRRSASCSNELITALSLCSRVTECVIWREKHWYLPHFRTL